MYFAIRKYSGVTKGYLSRFLSIFVIRKKKKANFVKDFPKLIGIVTEQLFQRFMKTKFSSVLRKY